MRKLLSKIGGFLGICFLAITLTGCLQQNTEEITASITEFITACGNSDYGLATGYLADSVLNSKVPLAKDDSGLTWVRLPDMVSEKMPDNQSASIEVRKYIGYGLKLTYGDAKVDEIEVNGDHATVLLKGKGTLLHWNTTEDIYEKISSATNTEWMSDYEWYTEKIKSKGQETVFSDIRNKVTPSVFKNLTEDLNKQEKINYIKQVYMVKDKDGKWKIEKVITHKDDGTNKNWFGEDGESE